eukprot:4750465-Ditylum_brightwellii.AAC.2
MQALIMMLEISAELFRSKYTIASMNILDAMACFNCRSINNVLTCEYFSTAKRDLVEQENHLGCMVSKHGPTIEQSGGI